MKKIILLCLLAAAGGMAAGAQSLYSNAVMSFHPVAYWPLQETTQPPSYDIETNIGSFGSIANAYYSSAAVLHGQDGAVAGDSSVAVNNHAFAIVPTTDNRVSLPAGKPFTVECWMRQAGTFAYRGIVSQTGPRQDGINSSGSGSGWELSVNYAPYRFTAAPNNPPAWTFHVFNGVSGATGGADAESANTNIWLSGGATGYVNSWIYLCGVFDGTNAWLYVYSTNMDNATYGGTNSMNLQFPITTAAGAPYGGPPDTSLTNAEFSPDTWDPIQFGAERGVGANYFNGNIDEVAIYTNALTSAQILSHFEAGTNAAADYQATILSNNPVMYWRMDAPAWAPPSLSSYPAAMNYGSAASSMTNLDTGTSGTTSAVYQPGTVPGVPGPSYGGFGPDSKACAFNGIAGAVDAGYSPLLDPTDVTNNFTLVAWFKGNPMDAGNRWNCLASHSNQSWKAQFQNGKVFAYKGAGAQANIAPTTVNVNDGQWHMYTLESTTGNAGTNVALYLDSGAYSVVVANQSTIPGATNVDAWIGGAPDYAEPADESSYNTAQQYLAGEVCQVAYFTNALTPEQINDLYSAARPEPLILRQPASGVAGAGGVYTTSVGASGQHLMYQWYKDNAPIANQTNANLVLNPVQTSDASTNYYVVVTNNYGAVTSDVASLTVVSNLAIVAQSPVTYASLMTLYGGQNVGGTNYLGSTPTFSVSAVGAVPISYQWRTNGVAVGGATNTHFTFTNCQMSSPTSFDCVMNNAYGSLTSMVWSVSYTPAPMAPYPQAVLAADPVGYWRLNEPDDGAYDGNQGAICNDYQSGNNGIYTNIYLHNIIEGTGYSPMTDPNEYAAEFGIFTGSSINNDAFGISNIDLGVAAGENGQFTVSAWANGLGYAQAGNAGLVTKGYFNGEEFTLDEGSTLAATGLRFYVRDALGNGYNASSRVVLANDSNWHFIVGVCDEASGEISLYVDGVRVGSATIPSGAGIINSADVPLMIGARSGSAGNPGNNQFKGLMNDVAIYKYAMSADQIANQYAGVVGPIAPSFIAPMPSSSAGAAAQGTLTIPATAFGTPPIGYVWTNLTTGATVSGGATNGYTLNATLNYNNVPASWDTNLLELIVTNAYGTTNVSVTLSITNTVNLNPTNLVFSATGNQLTLTWPADHTGWTLQAQTNELSVGVSTNWVDVANSATTNRMIIPIDSNNSSVFYRLIYRR